MRWMSLAKQAPRCWRRLRTWRASGERAAASLGSSMHCWGEGVGEPLGGVADVEGNGRGVGWDDAAGGGAVADGPCRVGRDAAPPYGSGEAEIVEMTEVVAGDARRKQGALPFDGRGFETFELAEGFENAFFAGELRLRGKMLPAEEPVHINGRSDGFDLLATGSKCEAVDALEDTALAPFDFEVVGGWWVFEGSAHEEALHLHGEEGFENFGWLQVEEGCEGVCGGGAENL